MYAPDTRARNHTLTGTKLSTSATIIATIPNAISQPTAEFFPPSAACSANSKKFISISF